MLWIFFADSPNAMALELQEGTMTAAYFVLMVFLTALCIGVSLYFYKTQSRSLFLSVCGVNVSILLTALSAKNATALYDQVIIVVCLFAAAAFHLLSLRSASSQRDRSHK